MTTLYGLWVDGVEVLDGGFRRARYAESGACSSSSISFNLEAFPNPLSAEDPYDEVEVGDGPDDETNPAPWMSEAWPESADFHGFWSDTPNGLVGLDSTPIDVPVSQLGGRLGGAYLGGARNGPREVTVTLWASADTELAMNYGLRWLAQRLLGTNRLGCTRPVIAIRDAPADPENPTRGLHLLHGAGLTTAPVAIEADDDECLLRKVTFTITAGDPCLYGQVSPIDNITVTYEDCDTLGMDAYECGPVPDQTLCVPIPAPGLGASGAVIDIVNPSEFCTGDLVIETWVDSAATGCGTEAGDANFTVGIASIPPGGSLKVNMARREVLYKPSGGSWGPGFEYLVLHGGAAPTWPIASDTALIVKVGPANGADIPPDTGFDVAVASVTKTGCAF